MLNKNNRLTLLNVVGYGGDAEYYKRIAIHLGVNDQVKWIDTTEATIKGSFDQLYRKVLEETDLVVLPCITSSQGDNEAGPALVLCLAQASGTPVLTTPFKGHEISINDGVTGLLSAEGDSNSLAKKIEWAIENPVELNVIAKNGEVFVRNLFDQATSINYLFELIIESTTHSSQNHNKSD
jgi:glycosyltransferase involved in cell wall biosynthesis